MLTSQLPWHEVPSPVKPGLHVQLKDPSEFAQSASEEHGLGSAEHSLIST